MWPAIHIGKGYSKINSVCLDMPSPDSKDCFGRWGGRNHLIQWFGKRYSNVLWNMQSVIRH